MRTHSQRFRLTASVAISSLLLGQLLPSRALAQGAPPPPPMPPPTQVQQGDPPARVGRLSQINGTVSFHTQDETQWNAAALNYPVTSGNAFWTDQSARATIELSATRIVMAPGTELDIANLTDTAFQGTLPQGEVYIHVRTASPDETYAVQTPRGLVNMAAGRYGIVAGDTQNPTAITVIEGTAEISAPGINLTVNANQAATITGSDTFQGSAGPAQPDQFLTAMLNAERPPPQQQVATPAVVAAMPGGDDLSAYGTWADTSDYGNVWYPQVSQDWVPYRDGTWAYVAPWGWTWVDSDPWGFAPFHYGRWSQIGGRWGWIPGGGVVAGPPVYAPALVTFLGIGAAVGVGVGIGAALAGGRVGWVPLGPREAYHPWYHASTNYVRQVNISHVTNITTINRDVTINNFANRGAATVVPATALTESRPVRQVAQRVDPAQLAQARPVIGTQPIRPAAATVGVTPAVAREMHLQPGPAASRPAAPGPAIRPVLPAAAGTAAQPFAPKLHNPAENSIPAAAAAHPPGISAPGTPAAAGLAAPAIHPPSASGPSPGTPALRPPNSPGHMGPPPVTSAPAALSPGQPPHLATPSGLSPQVAHPAEVPRPAEAGPVNPAVVAPRPIAPPAPAPHPLTPTSAVISPHPMAPPPQAAPQPVAPPPQAPHPVAPAPAAIAPHPVVAPPPPAPHPVAPTPAVVAPHPVAPPPQAPHPVAPPPAAVAPPHVAAPPPPAPHPAAPPPAPARPAPQQRKRPGEP